METKKRKLGIISSQVELGGCDWMREGDVNEMNTRLVQNVNMCAEKTIERRKVSNRRVKGKVWWTREIGNERSKRRELNKKCRQLRKRQHLGDEQMREYENAWDEYVKQQRKTKRLIREALVKLERCLVEKLRENGEEGSRNWHRFSPLGSHLCSLHLAPSYQILDSLAGRPVQPCAPVH